jgi:hypothetical protein
MKQAHIDLQAITLKTSYEQFRRGVTPKEQRQRTGKVLTERYTGLSRNRRSNTTSAESTKSQPHMYNAVYDRYRCPEQPIGTSSAASLSAKNGSLGFGVRSLFRDCGCTRRE